MPTLLVRRDGGRVATFSTPGCEAAKTSTWSGAWSMPAGTCGTNRRRSCSTTDRRTWVPGWVDAPSTARPRDLWPAATRHRSYPFRPPPGQPACGHWPAPAGPSWRRGSWPRPSACWPDASRDWSRNRSRWRRRLPAPVPSGRPCLRCTASPGPGPRSWYSVCAVLAPGAPPPLALVAPALRRLADRPDRPRPAALHRTARGRRPRLRLRCLAGLRDGADPCAAPPAPRVQGPRLVHHIVAHTTQAPRGRRPPGRIDAARGLMSRDHAAKSGLPAGQTRSFTRGSL